MLKNFSRIAAGEFKAKCLQLMDQVNQTHVPIVITKHGVPIAKLVPVEESQAPLFGLQKDSVVIKGDIVSPIEEDWNACK
jgi:prevent-host-death family protein